MLWFNLNSTFSPETKQSISIHLMLWFNINILHIIIWNKNISIHLMLWFNLGTALLVYGSPKFQYILCYGSTGLNLLMSLNRMNFNTSYVMVQPPPYVRVTNNSFISIHLMLWFNLYVHARNMNGIVFQYILCYGSTRQQITIAFDLINNFNTSYVMVQLLKFHVGT